MEFCPECGLEIEKETCKEQEPAVIDQEQTLCREEGSSCEETGEMEEEISKAGRTWKIVLSAVAVAALLCVMAVVLFKDLLIPGHWFSTLPGTIPGNGYSENVTCQGTYTDSVLGLKWNRNTVVAQLGDYQLTNGQLQVLYDMAQYDFIQENVSLAGMNLDFDLPLDRQTCSLNESLTWQQYFLQVALNQWKMYVVLTQEAEKTGYELPEKNKEALAGQYDKLYKDYVETGKFSSVDAVIQDTAGLGCTFEDYQSYAELKTIGLMYYNQLLGEYEVTEELIEACYEEYKEYLEENNIKKGDGNYLVDVRHMLITVKAATGKEEHIDERDWEACKTYAQKILDEWLAGEATEESFSAMVEYNSADPGSNLNGGLYAGVQKGEMVEEFDEWCFDASRKAGDYGLIKTDYGYHIMYFSGSEEVWHAVCEEQVPLWQANLHLDELMKQIPMQAHYEKISLWESAYSQK